jgi:TRAP-type mannitol/chloroaromatic compound transport system permease small subunit
MASLCPAKCLAKVGAGGTGDFSGLRFQRGTFPHWQYIRAWFFRIMTRIRGDKNAMQGLLKLSRLIDATNERIGHFIYWLVLLAVLISAGNAIVRKAFNMSSNAMLEVQWYLFSAVFLLGAGYTFLKNAHVRIDFLANHFSARMRNWIDIIGMLVFLLPLCVVFIKLSWPLFANAWSTGEMSQNAGGLIRWPAYLLVPLGFALLLAQSFSELIKRVAFLRGVLPDPLAHHEPGNEDDLSYEIEEHAAHAREELR